MGHLVNQVHPWDMGRMGILTAKSEFKSLIFSTKGIKISRLQAMHSNISHSY